MKNQFAENFNRVDWEYNQEKKRMGKIHKRTLGTRKLGGIITDMSEILVQALTSSS